MIPFDKYSLITLINGNILKAIFIVDDGGGGDFGDFGDDDHNHNHNNNSNNK